MRRENLAGVVSLRLPERLGGGLGVSEPELRAFIALAPSLATHSMQHPSPHSRRSMAAPIPK